MLFLLQLSKNESIFKYTLWSSFPAVELLLCSLERYWVNYKPTIQKHLGYLVAHLVHLKRLGLTCCTFLINNTPCVLMKHSPYRGHELLRLCRRHQLRPRPLHGGWNHRHVRWPLHRFNHSALVRKNKDYNEF